MNNSPLTYDEVLAALDFDHEGVIRLGDELQIAVTEPHGCVRLPAGHTGGVELTALDGCGDYLWRMDIADADTLVLTIAALVVEIL